MAGKAKTPAPIDRPLAKAYLREFTGWSTAYPPGVSDPTTLRVMHNCSIAADGALRIRPGLRRVLNTPNGGDIVGDFEHFYTVDGRKAILYAIRESSLGNKVGFRTAVWNDTTKVYDRDLSIAARFPGYTDAEMAFAATTTYVKYVQIDNKILALSNSNEPFRMFWVGSAPRGKAIVPVTFPNYTAADRLSVVHPAAAWISGAKTTIPTAETASTTTLISSSAAANQYNFAYFYTFNNEIGESAPSQVTVAKTQRRWSAWNANTADETLSQDQLVAIIPAASWAGAMANKATSWNLYYLTWSDQDSVPVEGILVKTTEMPPGATRDRYGWAAHTPLVQARDVTHMLPRATNRDQSTEPSHASNGLVAGDRLVLVNDRENLARIAWTSNQQGDYLNFAPAKGGGFKTLTSGNLYVPVTVKLWQNPQSVDTITVLCAGMDGYGSAFYMAPNSNATTQSQSTNLMGFEETTATPGTVSPYGCEVLHNNLYHPLDNNLMKSTASNYNINHKMLADPIQNLWQRIPLKDKRRMVSSQMDSTLYYLVRSPIGWETAPETANGNQVWTCDTSISDAWSCWDVVGTSLRKLEVDGLLYMAISSGPSLYVFDSEYDSDDVWEEDGWTTKGIRWSAVTNTQGANRAHDAWAHLTQMNVLFGNFTGECVYGVRGKDMHGMPVEVRKHYISPERGHDPYDRYDMQDFLLIRRGMKEWEFFWESAPMPKNRSYGSVLSLQYRYTPISVNIDYENGSVETFEYGNRTPNYSNGVQEPMADIRKP